MEMEKKKFKRVVPENVRIADLNPFNITCGTTKCEEGFHCFSQKKSTIRKYGKERVCRECGVDLIDWKRIHKNDIKDSAFTFKALKTEIIRHVFWHTPFQDKALLNSYKRGKALTKEKARKLLKTRIGRYNDFMDGRQTPMGQEEVINYAQHATATCCRKCLEAWHNIPMTAELNEKQLDFCVDLVMKFVEERLPGLQQEEISGDEALKKIKDENH